MMKGTPRGLSSALLPVAMSMTALLMMASDGAPQARVTSRDNKHNLSTGGPGPVQALAMTEICVFCHTPHNHAPTIALWNQTLPAGVTYTPYASSTMAAAVGQPNGSTKLCLSCHDGTVAIANSIARGRFPMAGLPSHGRLTGANVLGLDLSDDHPVSFAPIVGPQIVRPPAGDPVKLDGDGLVQCTSCHDPHRMDKDVTTKKFLVKSNSASGLCLTCHDKAYWSTNPSTHKTSTRPYTPVQGAHTGYTTVATNGCESCHKSHAATTGARNLKDREEATCGTAGGSQCHGSSGVATYNIAAEFSKVYRHPTYDMTPSTHDAAESPTSATIPLPERSSAVARHAECPDCHNAHASYGATASAPKASGKLAGVWGVNTMGILVAPSGTPASVNEYEICFKCHAGSANKPQQLSGLPYGPYPNRQLIQFDMSLMFAPTAVSFHPVAATGRNASVPSLIAPWLATSLMYCSDCHDNDTGPKAAPSPGAGPSGVHGSNIKHLLLGRYEMDNGSYAESAVTYSLCYKCHDRSSVLGDVSFKEHNKHVVGAQAPCSICHDPHGISSTQGNSTNNSHLINFDRRFVTASSLGILRFEDQGQGHGRCYLTCHAKDHNPLSY